MSCVFVLKNRAFVLGIVTCGDNAHFFLRERSLRDRPVTVRLCVRVGVRVCVMVGVFLCLCVRVGEPLYVCVSVCICLCVWEGVCVWLCVCACMCLCMSVWGVCLCVFVCVLMCVCVLCAWGWVSEWVCVTSDSEVLPEKQNFCTAVFSSSNSSFQDGESVNGNFPKWLQTLDNWAKMRPLLPTWSPTVKCGPLEVTTWSQEVTCWPPEVTMWLPWRSQQDEWSISLSTTNRA